MNIFCHVCIQCMVESTDIKMQRNKPPAVFSFSTRLHIYNTSAGLLSAHVLQKMHHHMGLLQFVFSMSNYGVCVYLRANLRHLFNEDSRLIYNVCSTGSRSLVYRAITDYCLMPFFFESNKS